MNYIATFESFLYERSFTSKERKDMIEKGYALPNGGYPIENVQDLMNAIQAWGRASDKTAVAKHIAKRAKELGKENAIPDTDKFKAALKG